MSNQSKKPGRPRKLPDTPENEAQRKRSRDYQRQHFSNMPPVKRWATTQIVNLKRRARESGKRHQVTAVMLEGMWQQSSLCPITHQPMTIQGRWTGQPPLTQATVVLIDRDGEYTPENISIVSSKAARSLAATGTNLPAIKISADKPRPCPVLAWLKTLLLRLLRWLD